MSQITPSLTVNDEQAKFIIESGYNVQICDRHGKHLGFLTRGFNEEDIDVAKSRMNSDGPWYTTNEVLAHLKSLECGTPENEPASIEEGFDLTEEDIAIAKMAMKSDGPRYTTKEVLDYLRSLEKE
jgi:hypothetical protein